jgi:hypothetical protein
VRVAPTDTPCVGGPVPMCRGPTIWVGAPCVRVAPTDTPCVGVPVPTKREIVGNSPTLCGEVRLRVQPLIAYFLGGSIGPRDLKSAAIRAGACVAVRQSGWARRVCGWPRRTRHVSAVWFQCVAARQSGWARRVCGWPRRGHAICQRSGSNNWYQNQVGPVHSQTNLGSQCVRGRLLGIVPHCVVR